MKEGFKFYWNLDKSSKKFICPSCGKKTFNKYVDEHGNYHDDIYGLCDRINNCNHHKPPPDMANGPNVKQEKQYTMPEHPKVQLTDKALTFFKSRGISLNTLQRFGVTADEKRICFNFYKDGELVNIKSRYPEKNFTLEKGAETPFYNHDEIKDTKTIVICEGEIDALTIYELDPNLPAVSLPNGAPGLSFLDKYLEDGDDKLEHLDEIIIATDNDKIGIIARDNLIARLGIHRCSYLSYPKGSKDINEVLLNEGRESALEVLKTRKRKDIPALATAEDWEGDITEFILNGFPKGIHCGDSNIDDVFTIGRWEFIVVSGTPNVGKTTAFDWLTSKYVKHNPDLNIGICSPESNTAVQITKIARHYLERDIVGEGEVKEDVIDCMTLINDRYTFIKTTEMDNMSADEIIGKMKAMNKMRGTNFFIVDPFNYIEREKDEEIVTVLRKFSNFAKMYNSPVVLVAHPRKMEKQDDGNYKVVKPYDIAGSNDFYNIPDTIVSFWRDFINKGPTTGHIQKVRNEWLAECPGYFELEYLSDKGTFKALSNSKSL